MNIDRDQYSVEQDLLRRLDPGGELGDLVTAFYPLIDSRMGQVILGFLGRFGINADLYTQPIINAKQLVSDMANAIIAFCPLGWAPTALAPIDVYRRALDVYHQTGSIDQVEHILVEGWNEPHRLAPALRRLRSLGKRHRPLDQLFLRRAELVEKALAHHEAGAYEASVPITLAQIDGLVLDVTQSETGFFYRPGKGEHLYDETTVAGIGEGLNPLRKLFSHQMKESGASGKLSRHGILHGRELGYDTKMNSTKVLVLLIAVIEWAQPRASALAERKQLEQHKRYAGTDAVDEQGRRLDNQEFDQAKKGLRHLAIRQHNEFRRHGQYGPDLDAMFPGEAGDEYLCGKNKITLITSTDRTEYWAWRSTPSEFCFGIAGRNGPPAQWLYAGPEPPRGGIDADIRWKGLLDDTPPDWR